MERTIKYIKGIALVTSKKNNIHRIMRNGECIYSLYDAFIKACPSLDSIMSGDEDNLTALGNDVEAPYNLMLKYQDAIPYLSGANEPDNNYPYLLSSWVDTGYTVTENSKVVYCCHFFDGSASIAEYRVLFTCGTSGDNNHIYIRILEDNKTLRLTYGSGTDGTGKEIVFNSSIEDKDLVITLEHGTLTATAGDETITLTYSNDWLGNKVLVRSSSRVHQFRYIRIFESDAETLRLYAVSNNLAFDTISRKLLYSPTDEQYSDKNYIYNTEQGYGNYNLGKYNGSGIDTTATTYICCLIKNASTFTSFTIKEGYHAVMYENDLGVFSASLTSAVYIGSGDYIINTSNKWIILNIYADDNKDLSDVDLSDVIYLNKEDVTDYYKDGQVYLLDSSYSDSVVTISNGTYNQGSILIS